MTLGDGTSKLYHGCLVAFLGDTPASALAGGFKEGVGGAYRCCSTCMVASEDLSSIVSRNVPAIVGMFIPHLRTGSSSPPPQYVMPTQGGLNPVRNLSVC